jgi:HAD superfamily hydrolase (TIGR01490 family)
MNLALFDFDGTITFSDTFMPFIYLATSRSRIVAGSILLSPLIGAYKLGLLATSRMRAAIARVTFSGRSEAEIAQLGQSYGQSLRRVVRPEALAKIRWHQSQGDDVVVVSASLDVYLRAWCSEHGVALICTELEALSGVLTGRYAAGDCSGPEKARRAQAKYDLSRYSTVFAYGDTREDSELLALASRRFFRWQELT